MIKMDDHKKPIDWSITDRPEKRISDAKIINIQGLPTIYIETEDNIDASKYTRKVIQVSGESLKEAEDTLDRLLEQFKIKIVR